MKSIKASIIVPCAIAFVLASVAALSQTYFVVRHRVIDHFDAGLRIKAEALATLIDFDNGDVDLDERDASLRDFLNPTNPSYFELRDPRGRTADRSAALDRSLPIALPLQTIFHAEATTLPDGRSGRICVLPVIVGPDGDSPRAARDSEVGQPPSAWVIVASGDGEVRSTLRDVTVALLISIAGLAIAATVVIPYIVSRGLRPLRRMAEWTSRINADTLADRLPMSGLPSELAPIATQLNASLDRINDAFARERRFAAGAAHELRTPLAAIRTNAEVALRWPEPSAMESALKGTLTSAERMQSLIERLLQLARLGHETAGPSEPIAMRDVIESALASVDARMAARGVAAEFDVPAGWIVHSDPLLLQPLVDNLIANAARHSEAGSIIRVSADVAAARVTITNAAPDMRAGDLPRLFEPLWTRSADRGEGAGLGLALAAEYARVLKVRIEPSLAVDGSFSQQLSFLS